MFVGANLLQPDVFPGPRKMEAEIVAMVCNMFKGGKDACGVVGIPGFCFFFFRGEGVGVWTQTNANFMEEGTKFPLITLTCLNFGGTESIKVLNVMFHGHVDV